MPLFQDAVSFHLKPGLPGSGTAGHSAARPVGSAACEPGGLGPGSQLATNQMCYPEEIIGPLGLQFPNSKLGELDLMLFKAPLCVCVFLTL